jgi:hypothetical protein
MKIKGIKFIEISYPTTALIHSQSNKINADINVEVQYDQNDVANYFLTSPHLNMVEEPLEIWETAISLLKIYNGSNLLFYEKSPNEGQDNYSSLLQEVKDIYSDKDERIIPIKVKTWDIEYSKTPFNKNVIINPIAPNFTRNYLIRLSTTEIDVFNLLLLLSNGLDWVSLYCLRDTVNYYSREISEAFFKQVNKDANVSSKKYNAFGNTADSFGLIGLSARHGVIKKSTNKLEILTLAESRSIILSLVKSYLKLKYQIS